jgi:hypothetical protein
LASFPGAKLVFPLEDFTAGIGFFDFSRSFETHYAIWEKSFSNYLFSSCVSLTF